MDIVIVYQARWKIAAVVTAKTPTVTRNALEDFFDSLDDSYQTNVDGILALITRAAGLANGSFGLTADQCHPANSKSPQETVFEFIKGALRVFFFVDRPDRIVVVTGGVIKKSQKADPQKVAQAERALGRYLQCKKLKTLNIIDPEEE